MPQSASPAATTLGRRFNINAFCFLYCKSLWHPTTLTDSSEFTLYVDARNATACLIGLRWQHHTICCEKSNNRLSRFSPQNAVLGWQTSAAHRRARLINKPYNNG